MGTGHTHTPAGRNKRRLALVFGFTLLYLKRDRYPQQIPAIRRPSLHGHNQNNDAAM